MFSSRAIWNAPLNRLTIERRERAAAGLPVYDLTETNPTRVGLAYPVDELAEILASAAAASYQPHPRGIERAREALAAELSTGRSAVSPDDLLLTASTSEAYSFLFRLLMNPGDHVLTPTPAYPLLEHIAALDATRVDYVRMELHGRRWEIDAAAVGNAITGDTRAVVVVHPNNPTGNYVKGNEQDELAEIVRAHGAALISDEVFYDYAIRKPHDAAPPLFQRDDVLSFTLGGLSKSAGLPHWKLGWICVGGPEEEKRRAIEALELIADTFLSVSTPVQEALPDLLRLSVRIREAIRQRVLRNLARLREEFSLLAFGTLFEPEGGWSAVLRLPRTAGDEQIAHELLQETGVVVQPGYFFDFAGEGFFVLSLLCEESVFAEGVSLFGRFCERRFGS